MFSESRVRGNSESLRRGYTPGHLGVKGVKGFRLWTFSPEYAKTALSHWHARPVDSFETRSRRFRARRLFWGGGGPGESDETRRVTVTRFRRNDVGRRAPKNFLSTVGETVRRCRVSSDDELFLRRRSCDVSGTLRAVRRNSKTVRRPRWGVGGGGRALRDIGMDARNRA